MSTIVTDKLPAVRAKGETLNLRDLASWANTVHKMSGGKNDVFTEDMMPDRLKGYHCDCGTNEQGYSKGSFDLLPLYDEAVKSGGKAYMTCRVCGGVSHL